MTKKYIVLAFLVAAVMMVLGSCSGSAETPREAAIRKAKAWYDQRVQSFRRENDSLQSLPGAATQIVLLGDSFTERLDVQNSFPGLPVVNRGISSDHIVWDESRGVIHRLTPELLAPHPSHIIMLVGVNDLGDDNSPERVVSLSHPYEQILRRLRDTFPSAKICICTLLPAGGRYARLNESIRNFNSKLMELAQSTKTPVLDLYPMFSDGTGALKSTITTDGLHIVPAAYAPWIEKVKQFIAEVPGQ